MAEPDDLTPQQLNAPATHHAGHGHAPDARSDRRAAAILQLILVGVAVVAIGGWLVLGLAHLGDRYRVGHVQGAWMGLAQYANDGVLYPPLADGERYAGTRYLPLPILVHDAAARVTGEYLISGKATAIVLFGAVLVLALAVLRTFRCPWPHALALVALVPATIVGRQLGSTINGDVLPVLLQVGALALLVAAVDRDRRPLLVAAGVLAGLAVASKLNGFWAPLAALSWLGLRGDWRRLVPFGVSCAATAVLVLGLVQWASDGRFLATFVALTFAGTEGPAGLLRAPNQLLYYAIGDATAVWTLGPFVVLGTLAAWRGSALTVYHHALAWALGLTIGVFIDVGAGFNQLIDIIVLSVIVVGHFAARLPSAQLGGVSLATLLALTVIWSGVTGVRAYVPELREVVAAARAGAPPARYTPRPLASIVGPDDSLLSEDPSVPVLLGRRPIVLDPFMLRRLDALRPDLVDPLLARIERREFDHVVLINALEDEDEWWTLYHFGPRIAAALRSAYVRRGMVDGYYLYAPVGN
jgi:hypothetical protein